MRNRGWRGTEKFSLFANLYSALRTPNSALENGYVFLFQTLQTVG